MASSGRDDTPIRRLRCRRRLRGSVPSAPGATLVLVGGRPRRIAGAATSPGSWCGTTTQRTSPDAVSGCGPQLRDGMPAGASLHPPSVVASSVARICWGSTSDGPTWRRDHEQRPALRRVIRGLSFVHVSRALYDTRRCYYPAARPIAGGNNQYGPSGRGTQRRRTSSGELVTGGLPLPRHCRPWHTCCVTTSNAVIGWLTTQWQLIGNGTPVSSQTRCGWCCERGLALALRQNVAPADRSCRVTSFLPHVRTARRRGRTTTFTGT